MAGMILHFTYLRQTKKDSDMKNGQISFALLLAGALMGGCAKEDALPINQLNPVQNIEASFNFEVGGRSYSLNAVQYDAADASQANEPSCGGTPSASSSPGSHSKTDWTNDWTSYSAAAKSVFIARQDLAVSPNLRLVLRMNADLDNLSVPTAPLEATLGLTDISGLLVPDNDDPLARKNTNYQASGDVLQIKITSVKDNRIEGVFGGKLKTGAGASVELSNGSFKATLKKY
jgi:hypothetical protein